MSKLLSPDKIGEQWDKASVNDKILAFNTLGVVGLMALQIAECSWESLETDIKAQIIKLQEMH